MEYCRIKPGKFFLNLESLISLNQSIADIYYVGNMVLNNQGNNMKTEE